jgi:hypothetical protein
MFTRFLLVPPYVQRNTAVSSQDVRSTCNRIICPTLLLLLECFVMLIERMLNDTSRSPQVSSKVAENNATCPHHH